MRMIDIIMKKRNKGELLKEEISYLIEGYVNGEIPDYQMSAFLMAVYFNGMTDREISDLTMEMARSGDMLTLSGIQGIKVDKHSTGGIGDKTTLILGPMVASLGIPVAKMSGRGLGYTGGTIDKLESIPGFRTAMGEEEFIKNVNDVKFALTGQTGNLAPADKKIYALRDVTATVDSIPLIASSIMSKKIASGAQAIVLDVKVGSGAFMKTVPDAVKLAQTMVNIGKNVGRKTVAVISDMNQPLGLSVGNSLEVIEAMDVLKGEGPEDVRKLCIILGKYMVNYANPEISLSEAEERLNQSLDNNSALNKFREFVERQGGNPHITEDYSILPHAEYVIPLKSECEGYITAIEASEVGNSSIILGAGREKKGESINEGVGIVLNKKINDIVHKGDVLAYIHADDMNKADEAGKRLYNAFVFDGEPAASHSIVYDIIE